MDYSALRDYLQDHLSIRLSKDGTGNPDECRLTVELVLCGEVISSDSQTVRDF